MWGDDYYEEGYEAWVDENIYGEEEAYFYYQTGQAKEEPYTREDAYEDGTLNAPPKENNTIILILLALIGLKVVA